MKNWKIGTRIVVGFALMMAATIILGVFAFLKIEDIQASKSNLVTADLPAIVLLSSMTNRSNHQIALLGQSIDSHDPKEQSALQEEITALGVANGKIKDSYLSLPSGEEEKALAAIMLSSRAAKVTLLDKSFAMGVINTPATDKKAREILDLEVRPAQEKYTDSIQALVNLKLKQAQLDLLNITASVDNSKRGILIAILIAVMIAIPISIVITRSIVVPIKATVAVLEKMEQCDLTVSLDVDTKDEIGRMAVALNATLRKLRTTLQTVSDSATNASASSSQLAAAAEAIAAGSQEQAASLEETSASLEQITATVRQSADNSKQANQLASSSRETAEKGQQVVSQAVAAMEEINVASAKISDIISTIDEIAFQTNLLAVNAAVEAARAGEEGRGFAVVAAEVRSLAQRSAGAAKEIKGLIQDTLKKVERGTGLVNKSGETLQTIVSSVRRVTDIVAEISAAAEEQSIGVDQVNTAVTQIDQVTQSNSTRTEELSSTALSLAEQSLHLTQMVNIFKLSEANSAAQELTAPWQPQTTLRSPSAASSAAARVSRHGSHIRTATPARTSSAKAYSLAALVPAGHEAASEFEEF